MLVLSGITSGFLLTSQTIESHLLAHKPLAHEQVQVKYAQQRIRLLLTVWCKPGWAKKLLTTMASAGAIRGEYWPDRGVQWHLG